MNRLLFVKPCEVCGVAYSTERKLCNYCKIKLKAKIWFNSFKEFDDYLDRRSLVEQAN